jgi:hypothetical protein
VANNAPILVRDADQGQTVTVSASLTLSQGFNGGAANLYTVPAGKRFILEYVSCHSTGGEDERAYPMIQFGGNAAGNTGGIQHHYLTPTSLGPGEFVCSQPIRMVFEPSDFVLARIFRTSTNTSITADFSITGRLVDAI